MSEDQHAQSAGRFDEACRGDRLARRRWMAEPVAPDGAGVRAGVLLRFLVEDVLGRILRGLALLFFLDGFGGRAVSAAVPVAVRVGFAFVRCDQLGEHPGERVDLVAAQLRAGGEMGTLLREHAFETEHEAVLDLPAGRGRATSGLDLSEGVVERSSA